ncbi:MAG: fluoride efflux transporter CrcB [Planctomycetes bacterium]|nr:fluoride efflux transporter CrcB [Planctomycetota bacterium]
MFKLLIIGFGGFIGAISRYSLSGAVQRLYGGIFPLGTMAVNVLGCLFIGIAMTLVEEKSLLSPNLRLFFIVGLLGSLTTFSTFGYETLELLRDGEFWWAMLSILGNLVVGIGAVIIGRFAIKAICL